MDIINLIVKCLTWLGVAHRVTKEQQICRKKGILIEDIKAFKKGDFCGHIFHEPAKSLKDAKTLCMKPFYSNFFCGLVCLIPSAYSIFYMQFAPGANFAFLVSALLFLAGISFWTNLFPSVADSLSFSEFAASSGKGFVRFESKIMSFGSKMEKTGITLITSVIAAFLLAFICNLILPLCYNFANELSTMMGSVMSGV